MITIKMTAHNIQCNYFQITMKKLYEYNMYHYIHVGKGELKERYTLYQVTAFQNSLKKI